MKYPDHLSKLIQVMQKLPGVGGRSAERFAFHLLGWKKSQLQEFAHVIDTIKENLTHCHECGCLKDLKACLFCEASARDKKTLCIVASPKDVFALEQTREYRGLYHVLGGLLSPLERRGPQELNIENLKKRLTENGVTEIIIALDSTIEGDATSLYLKQELSPLCNQISRLAFGLPMGSSFDYVDGSTLARAVLGRNQF